MLFSGCVVLVGMLVLSTKNGWGTGGCLAVFNAGVQEFDTGVGLTFHWQSQNTDSHNNKGGHRYTEQLQSNCKIILFVREEKKDGFGNTSPFHCFGLVDYVSSHGDYPMNVTWKLHSPAMAQYLKAI